jgi:hypothetical protein
MPEIVTYHPPNGRNKSSAAPAVAPGARDTHGLPARLKAIMRRIVTAIQSRAAEILAHEIPVNETSAVPYIQCEHCGDIHPMNVRCGSRATGFCVNEHRRRLLNGGRCASCGSRSVTDVHFRWAVAGGHK